MLEKLEQLLQINFKDFEMELKDIPNSPCPSILTNIFYFDGIKEEFSNRIGSRENLRSVDVLFFLNSKNELYLIEAKKLTRKTEGYESTESFCTRFVYNELNGKSLLMKIIDSIFILLGIMGYYDISKDFYSFFLDPSKLKIKTFLLADFTFEEINTMTIANLDKINIGLTRRITGETGILNCDDFEKYFSN